MNRRAWLLFLLVSVLWGIPYFLIKIAIDDLSPMFVVAGRAAIAALVLLPVAAARGTLGALRGTRIADSETGIGEAGDHHGQDAE